MEQRRCSVPRALVNQVSRSSNGVLAFLFRHISHAYVIFLPSRDILGREASSKGSGQERCSARFTSGSARSEHSCNRIRAEWERDRRNRHAGMRGTYKPRPERQGSWRQFRSSHLLIKHQLIWHTSISRTEALPRKPPQKPATPHRLLCIPRLPFCVLDMSTLGVELSFPAACIAESSGACWTCAERGLTCDESLPGTRIAPLTQPSVTDSQCSRLLHMHSDWFNMRGLRRPRPMAGHGGQSCSPCIGKTEEGKP